VLRQALELTRRHGVSFQTTRTIGDCYHNAMIQSFWGRMQTELLNRKRWRTGIELDNAIFGYLEIFHNRQRSHSSLGMRTRIEFELLQQSVQRGA
jgi:putative transposase